MDKLVLMISLSIIFILLAIHFIADSLGKKKKEKPVNKEKESEYKVAFYKDRFGHLKGETPYFKK